MKIAPTFETLIIVVVDEIITLKTKTSLTINLNNKNIVDI